MAQRKTHAAPGYRIRITPHINERLQTPTTLITLETAQSFASFRYELSVEERRESKKMVYTILGLKAPQIALPASGHARWTREYEALKGTYEFVVEGLDGTSTSFSVRFRSGTISVVKAPSTPHVQLILTSSTRADHKRT